MQALIEKRNELVLKLNSLEAIRQSEIDAKVADYRKELEAQYPTEQIDKVKNVILALDEVISFESSSVTIVADEVKQTPVVATPAETINARPGMTGIFTPERN